MSLRNLHANCTRGSLGDVVPREEYERVCRERDLWRERAERAEAKLRWEDELFGNDQLQATDKIVARTLHPLAQQAKTDRARQRVLNVGIADRAGLSPGTVGDAMKRLKGAGVVEYATVYNREIGKAEATFEPRAPYFRPRSIAAPRPKNGHGGKPACAHCPRRTPVREITETKRRYVCTGCGSVLHESMDRKERELVPVDTDSEQEYTTSQVDQCSEVEPHALNGQVDQTLHSEEDAEASAPVVDDVGTPETLLSRSQWVAWRIEERKGKPTKVPVSPRTGDEAKPNDLRTCGSRAEALEAVTRYGLAGVGYVFNGDQAGIDLDRCRDPKTGRLEPWALAIVRELDGYTEVSPSGTGVHIIVAGSLPPGGRRRGRIEMYDRGRYFTVTGQHLAGTPAAIVDRSAELAALHHRVFGTPVQVSSNGHARAPATRSELQILETARARRSGATFARLWRGDWQGYPSQSEADLALCQLLHRAGATAYQTDSLFRQSGLMRDKWDGRRGGMTYGQRTIETALG